METKFIAKTRVTSQGQVSIPKEARNDLGIKTGEELYIYEVGNSLVALKSLVSTKEVGRYVITEEFFDYIDGVKKSLDVDEKLRRIDQELLESGELTEDDFV